MIQIIFRVSGYYKKIILEINFCSTFGTSYSWRACKSPNNEILALVAKVKHLQHQQIFYMSQNAALCHQKYLSLLQIP